MNFIVLRYSKNTIIANSTVNIYQKQTFEGVKILIVTLLGS